MSPKAAHETHQLGIVARTLDERLDATGPQCSVRPTEGHWRIYLNDAPIKGTFETSRKALAAARHYKADMQQRIADEFFKTTGLSADQWSLNAHALVNRVDPAEFVVFYRRTYMAHIGCHALPSRKTMQEAIKLINTTFHLPGPMLFALEQVYGEQGKRFGPGAVNWSLFNILQEKGFISFDEREEDRHVHLTAAGRAALTRDPRGLSLELREIIFAGALPEERELRSVWNNLIGSSISGQVNAQGLRAAFANGYELRVEDGSDEGKDIILRGSGTELDGTPITDLMVASFPSQWEPFKVASKGLAEAIVRQQSMLKRPPSAPGTVG